MPSLVLRVVLTILRSLRHARQRLSWSSPKRRGLTGGGRARMQHLLSTVSLAIRPTRCQQKSPAEEDHEELGQIEASHAHCSPSASGRGVCLFFFHQMTIFSRVGNHWKLIAEEDVPKDTKILDAVWFMKRKRNIVNRKVYKWKARLNVHGGQQE